MMINIIYLCTKVKCSEDLQKKISDSNIFDLSGFKTSNITYQFDCEMLLGNKNHETPYEPSYEDLVEYENFLNNISPFSNSAETYKNSETFISNDFTSCSKIFLNKFEDYIKIFYDKLVRYIKYYVAKTFTKTYLIRVDRIMQTINMACKNQENDFKTAPFTKDIDYDCSNLINNLFKKYKYYLILNDEIYGQFEYDLDHVIEGFLLLKIAETSNILAKIYDESSKLLLYEYMQMYKSIGLIPEILTLGYVLTDKPPFKLIIIFHWINLFINEHKRQIHEKRIFIIFLIMKAFSHTSRNKTHLIGALRTQEIIQTEHLNLAFFCWEINYIEREIIRKKINPYRYKDRYLNEKDFIHFNIVFRIFIFQHLIFLKYQNAEYRLFEEFKTFYDKIMQTNGCYGCQFKEFMDLAQKQNADNSFKTEITCF